MEEIQLEQRIDKIRITSQENKHVITLTFFKVQLHFNIYTFIFITNSHNKRSDVATIVGI